MAKELNRCYERKGHFWSGRARIEEIVSDARAERLLGCGACNTVKDGLAEKALYWKGFSTNAASAHGERLIFFYVDRTLWWEKRLKRGEAEPREYTFQVEVKVNPPPAWRKLTVHKRQSRFRQIIRHSEREARISKERPFSQPKNQRIKTLQPLCHTDTLEECKEYEEEYREIVAAYRLASAYYRSGMTDVEFLPGTFRPRQSEAYEQLA